MIVLLTITLALAATAQGNVCGDLDASCALAGHLGYCQDAGFMGRCPFTCGICTCKDAWTPGRCAKAEQEGKCSSHHPTMINCKATCGICSCEDRPSAVGCKNFLAYGQCVVNPTANFECPATCKFCGECGDSLPNCEARAAAGQCFHVDMIHGCKKTCQLCGEGCTDATGLEQFCAALKGSDQCELQKANAYTLCSKSCGFCEEEGENQGEEEINNDPMAATKTAGIIQGRTVTLKDGKTQMHEFHNIRYGVSPTGNLRFRPPQRHIVSNTTKVYATDSRQITCVQGDDGQGSEDCLFLHVRSPDLNGSRPVIVWIHGGALKIGSGSDAGYSFDSETTHKVDAVTVNINYRLGFLGFSSVRELWDESEGVYANNGIRDMVAALDWIQENIAAFGGDPNSVTIMGESAGGTSVLALTCSPLANNKFHTAASLSPAPEMRFTHVQGDAFQRSYVDLLGCTQHTPALRKQCLLNLPASKFVSPLFHPSFAGSAYFDFPMTNGPQGEAFGYIMIDPVVVTVAPRNLKDANFAPKSPIKIIVSNTAEENWGTASRIQTEHAALQIMAYNLHTLTHRHDIPLIVQQQLYPGKGFKDAYSLLLSDMRSTCPTNDVVGAMSLGKDRDFYRLYVAHHVYPMRAVHGYTATFIFGGYVNAVFPTLIEEAHQFAEHMHAMLRKLAWDKDVEDSWEPFPATSMVYEKSTQISRVTEEQPQQAVCEILTGLDLVKYGWQN